MRVISASRSEWIAPFTGLEPGQFRKLVRVVAARGGEEIADGRPGRQWRLDLADRVLLVATYWRTNLTMRQIGPLFGVSHSAAHRVIATGDAHPGNRNDCTVYRDSGIQQELAGRPVLADGGYQGNSEVIMPYRKPGDGSDLPDWKEDLNAGHRTIRARVEHALARMKCWKILRDYRRAASTLNDTVSGIAHLHNIHLLG
ncbi:transposase family protein [Amycolatopsis cihanbeyliensis]|uniref:transposase family protein n=1 Tax=Amycolatopsis cihanbeyliensis TaxID=1128664 RepID=UPI0011508817|nr:transposase family protein [Amycolatopsis cihanbeyliensis]